MFYPQIIVTVSANFDRRDTHNGNRNSFDDLSIWFDFLFFFYINSDIIQFNTIKNVSNVFGDFSLNGCAAI